jgi:steroid 5-alpha reductase family enzyme
VQKHTQLKLRPGLITDGLFSLARSINYFGELLIYGAFVAVDCAALGAVWPAVYLMVYVSTLWLGMMRRKDKSLSRHQGFEEYRRRTAMFVPFVF